MAQRLHNRPWKGEVATDRRYAARVATAQARGEFTAPGTKPNVRDEAKVVRKRQAQEAKPMTDEETIEATTTLTVTDTPPDTDPDEDLTDDDSGVEEAEEETE